VEFYNFSEEFMQHWFISEHDLKLYTATNDVFAGKKDRSRRSIRIVLCVGFGLTGILNVVRV
jgi:hypothetical protein